MIAKPELVSAKNTKEQILHAYQSMLKELDKKDAPGPQVVQKKVEEQKHVERASKSADNIFVSIGTLKQHLAQHLDRLSEKLLEENETFQSLQKAIEAEKQHLEVCYGIKETANSLAALMEAHRRQKEQFEVDQAAKQEAFDAECIFKREAWKKEQLEWTQRFEEQKATATKKREREEEEYIYEREKTRRQERDQQAMEEQVLEQALAERLEDVNGREKRLAEQEADMAALRQQVLDIPEQLAAVKQDTLDYVTTQLQTQHHFEKELREKEVQGQSQLYQQTIDSLQVKVKEQEALIRDLTSRTDRSLSQVESIARQALDTATKRIYSDNSRPQEREKLTTA